MIAKHKLTVGDSVRVLKTVKALSDMIALGIADESARALQGEVGTIGEIYDGRKGQSVRFVHPSGNSFLSGWYIPTTAVSRV